MIKKTHEPLANFTWDEGPVVLLARHGETEKNAARLHDRDGASDFVQGVGLNVPLNERGRKQAKRQGIVLGSFLVERHLSLASIHSSDAKRAIDTRDIAVNAGGLEAPMYPPDSRLREISKGDFEGKRRSEVYSPDERERQQYEDWEFRHSNGETAAKAGARYKQWFLDAYESARDSPQSAVIAFGHNLVTSYGIAQLLGGDKLPDMRSTTNFKVDNGSALVVARRTGKWVVSHLKAN
ncbi:MAG TPA: histidine phosphatase family protein [Candidatus Saccharimonadales bacterium]|nr:histidine phosphatase family protein [Candidatus Saccharimonadales bacterium]